MQESALVITQANTFNKEIAQFLESVSIDNPSHVVHTSSLLANVLLAPFRGEEEVNRALRAFDTLPSKQEQQQVLSSHLPSLYDYPWNRLFFYVCIGRKTVSMFPIDAS